MSKIARIANALDRSISVIALTAGWLLLLLTLVVCFDVVIRRYFVFYSTFLQELEWHLHTVIFLFAIGYTYLRNAHVRIGIVRDALSPRRQAWLELVGIVVLLLPFAVLLVIFGFDYVVQSWIQGEGSVSLQGIRQRWIIKSAIPIGMILLIISAAIIATRNLLFLFGGGPPPEHFADGPGKPQSTV